MEILNQKRAEAICELNLLLNLEIRAYDINAQIKTPTLVGTNGQAKSTTLSEIAKKYGWKFNILQVGGMMKGDMRGIAYPTTVELDGLLKPLDNSSADSLRFQFIKHWIIQDMYDMQTAYCNILYNSGFKTKHYNISAHKNELYINDKVVYTSHGFMYDNLIKRDVFNNIPHDPFMELINEGIINIMLINLDEIMCVTPNVMTDIFPMLSDMRIDNYQFPKFVLLSATTNPWPSAGGSDVQFIYDGVYDPSPATIDRCNIFAIHTTNDENGMYLLKDNFINKIDAVAITKIPDINILPPYIENIDSLIDVATGQSNRSKKIMCYYNSDIIKNNVLKNLNKNSSLNKRDVFENSLEDLLSATISKKEYNIFIRARSTANTFVNASDVLILDDISDELVAKFKDNTTGMQSEMISQILVELDKCMKNTIKNINIEDLYDSDGTLDESKYDTDIKQYLNNIVKLCSNSTESFKSALLQDNIYLTNISIRAYLSSKLKIGKSRVIMTKLGSI